MRVFLDTHAALFLAEGRAELFGRQSRAYLEEGLLQISPIVRLELAFLSEVGRLKASPELILGVLLADCGVDLAVDPITAVVEKAMGLDWTRDPFDRLLVATAALHDAPFVSRDRNIREHYLHTVW